MKFCLTSSCVARSSAYRCSVGFSRMSNSGRQGEDVGWVVGQDLEELQGEGRAAKASLLS